VICSGHFSVQCGVDVLTVLITTHRCRHRYKNYVQLLRQIDVQTVDMPLSWYLVSKVKGLEGYLWTADPAAPPGSLRERFADDFRKYGHIERFVHHVTNFFTLNWFGGEISMYAFVFCSVDHIRCCRFGRSHNFYSLVQVRSADRAWDFQPVERDPVAHAVPSVCLSPLVPSIT
jgi:hypothetical protein